MRPVWGPSSTNITGGGDVDDDDDDVDDVDDSHSDDDDDDDDDMMRRGAVGRRCPLPGCAARPTFPSEQ